MLDWALDVEEPALSKSESLRRFMRNTSLMFDA